MRLTKFSLGLSIISSALCQSLTAALSSFPQLSGFAGLLSVAQLPTNLSNVTILAPSNQAISAIPNATLQALAASSALLNSVLSYHILQGNYPKIPNATFIPTLLQQNVTGGQRVYAVPGTNSTTFYTGLLTNSSTVNDTILFDGGSVHVINSFLTPPVNFSSTAVALNLTSAVGALINANLANTASTTSDLTFFVPNNAAFRAISSVIANVSSQTLATILQYHAVPGVFYSTRFLNGSTFSTFSGSNLTVTVVNGTVNVNNARVVLANVLTSNGVIHVIDGVLNPQNRAGFAGATSATSDVLNSGVPTPTSRINTAVISSAMAATSTSSGGGSGTASGSGGDSGDLSIGAKAAIGVVVPIVAIAAIVAAVFLTRRHMLKKNEAATTGASTTAPNSSEKAELAGNFGRTTTGESGTAYSKPELSNSKSVRRTEVDAGPVPVRHEVEGEGVSASIKNLSDLTNYERYELEGQNRYPQKNG